ncbi:hypothetical protein RND81_14G160600 [Saponaria officinalis]|uniref:Cysteine protease n=1 Tax=Saponaria officinalis TaxID=3572 RepID=A0AAW1GQD3_SAPOF
MVDKQCAQFYSVTITEEHAQGGLSYRVLSDESEFKLSYFELEDNGGLSLALQVVDIKRGDLEADTSSYHSNVVRQIPLESVDSSLAIGFYCRDRDDFNDFCSRATNLADESSGAPLFTVARSRSSPRATSQGDSAGVDLGYEDSYDMLHSTNAEGAQEDD